LYGTTRGLYRAIGSVLTQVQIGALGSPTLRALIVLYVTGLVSLDVRQTQTRVTDTLPARCHDTLNRLLRVMPLSTRLVIRLPWAIWTYAFTKRRKVY
jgi:hypothetical protein